MLNQHDLGLAEKVPYDLGAGGVTKQIRSPNECIFWVSNYTKTPLGGKPEKERKPLPEEQSCFPPGRAFCKVSTALCLQITFISVV